MPQPGERERCSSSGAYDPEDAVSGPGRLPKQSRRDRMVGASGANVRQGSGGHFTPGLADGAQLPTWAPTAPAGTVMLRHTAVKARYASLAYS